MLDPPTALRNTIPPLRVPRRHKQGSTYKPNRGQPLSPITVPNPDYKNYGLAMGGGKSHNRFRGECHRSFRWNGVGFARGQSAAL